MDRTFAPSGATVKIAVGAASSRVAIDPNTRAIRVVNTASAPAFIELGVSTVAATAAESMPILAGATETFTKGAATHVAAICPAGTGDVYFTCGEGL